MKKILTLVFILLCSCFSISAHQAKIDSLQKSLDKAKDNYRKIILLNELAKIHLSPTTLDTNKAKAEMEKIHQLSEAADNARGKVFGMLRQGSLLRIRKKNDAAIKLLEECKVLCDKNNLRSEMAEAMVLKASVIQTKKEYNDAIKLFNEALSFSSNLKDTQQCIGAYKGLGFCYYSIASFDSSIKYYSLLKELACFKDEINLCAHAGSMLGIMYAMRGDYGQSISLNNQAIVHYEALGLKSQVANVLNNSGNSYRFLGKYEEALKQYYKAIAIREELHDSSQLANPIFNAADILVKTGRKKNAAEYYRRSLAIGTRMGDKNMQAVSYGGIADMFRDEKESDSALAYHLHALELFEMTKDKASVPQSMVSIGNIYLDQAKYDEALTYFTKAKPLLEAVGLKQNLANVYGGLGRLHYVQNHYPEAEENFLQALSVSEEINYLEGKENYAWHLCWMYKRLDNYSKAFEYSSIASVANDSLFKRERFKAMQELTEKYESEKKAEQINILEKQQQIDRYDIELKKVKIRKQELADIEKTQRLELTLKDVEVKDLQVKQQNLDIEKQKEENEKKKSELALLQKESELQQANLQKAALVQRFAAAGIFALLLFGGISYLRYRQRKQLSEKLAASLTELKQMQKQLIETERQREQENLRFHISRDLHDDIGSTLSSINMLSRSAKKRMEEKDEVKLYESLEKIGERTQSTLDTMSDIIWSIKPGNDSLSYALSHMREYAGTVLEAKKINYSIDFPPDDIHIQIPLNLKNNLYLIFKEAVNNLAKYSQCTKATIELRIRDNKITMTIEDNGIGFDSAQTDGSKGNGLQNMKRRAEDSGAEITITSATGRGTRIEFVKLI